MSEETKEISNEEHEIRHVAEKFSVPAWFVHKVKHEVGNDRQTVYGAIKMYKMVPGNIIDKNQRFSTAITEISDSYEKIKDIAQKSDHFLYPFVQDMLAELANLRDISCTALRDIKSL